jgi:DNA-binding transcriptional LysR family regulator
MDWRSIRFDWNHARAFLVAGEEGSFSAAGRELGIAQPTIGRQVAALEEELGVALFERIGNVLELTSAGQDLMEHLRAMGDAATRSRSPRRASRWPSTVRCASPPAS